MTTLYPPASPRDAQRPATAADLAHDPILLASWRDYTAAVQAQAHARWQRTVRRRWHWAGITPPQPLITVAGPLGPYRRTWHLTGTYAWEPPQGPDDRRPTFADAVDATGRKLNDLCMDAGINPGNPVRIYHCGIAAQPETRIRLAALLGMDAAAIRWPIRIPESEGTSHG